MVPEVGLLLVNMEITNVLEIFTKLVSWIVSRITKLKLKPLPASWQLL
jgi:hypothetical protein